MALDQSALLELLGELKLTDVSDRIRVATETLYQELIDAEAAAFIGAAPYERTDSRTAQRNGTRPRSLTTTAGQLELRIPKLRTGSFFPSLLERRRRVDQALFAVVMEAYVHGVSPARSMTWSRRWARTPGSRSRRCRGSAGTSMRTSRRSGTGRSRTPPTRTCSSTRPTAKRGSAGGWCPKRSSSRSVSPRTGDGRSSGSRSATPSRNRSGPRSCVP